jgi:hypothetical protein
MGGEGINNLLELAELIFLRMNMYVLTCMCNLIGMDVYYLGKCNNVEGILCNMDVNNGS